MIWFSYTFRPCYGSALLTFPLPSQHTVHQYLAVPPNEHCNKYQSNLIKKQTKESNFYINALDVKQDLCVTWRYIAILHTSFENMGEPIPYLPQTGVHKINPLLHIKKTNSSWTYKNLLYEKLPKFMGSKCLFLFHFSI